MLAGLSVIALSSTANAAQIPVNVDVNELWSPLQTHVKFEGYLEFINPTEFPALIGAPVLTSPPGAIFTEEYTGYTVPVAGTPFGTDIIEVGDADIWAGDRADFDWVQENRFCETGGGPCNNAPQPVNHPGLIGAMGWTIGATEASPHVDPGTGAPHGHSVEEGLPVPPALPALANDDFDGDFFNVVDVFSIISQGQDTEATPRDAALDYVLDFGNSVTGASSPGVGVLVWIPGWTPLTGIDDYVARWVPLIPGLYDLVAIEPDAAFGFDERTEIDAIKAYLVPLPATAALFGVALTGLGIVVRRRGA
jgi:hypothetical protein